MQFYGISFMGQYKQDVLDTQLHPAIDRTASMDP
jgi:hypothetical protein